MGSDAPLLQPIPKPHGTTWIALVLLLGLTVFTFRGVFSHQFVEWDDHAFLFRNPDLNPPTVAILKRFWTWPYRNLYQPIPYSIWWLIAHFQYVANGNAPMILHPLPFHLANLIAHLIAVSAVFALLRTLIKSDLAAVIGAILFAVHPLQVEPVNWASSFYTIVNGAFTVTALWMYVLHAKAQNSRRRAIGMYVAATVFYLLALLSKPSAVTIPLIALLIDCLLLRRNLKVALRSIALWIVLAIPIAWFAKLVQPADYVPTPPIWSRPLVAMDAISFYLRKLVWPLHQTIDYSRTPQAIIQSGAIWWTWILPIAVLLTGWLLRRRFPWLIAALLISIAAVLPFSGLLKFEFQWFSTVADRYFYVAMIGPAIAFAFAIRAWPRMLIAPSILVIALLIFRSMQLSQTWSDTEQLIDNAYRVNPQSLVANNMIAYRAARSGDDRTALKYDIAALKIRPNDPAANANLGSLLLRHNRPEDAAEHLRVAAQTVKVDPQVRTNLGIALAQSGHLDEARENLQLACKFDPNSASALANLAGVDLELGHLDQAKAEYQAALAIDPNSQIAQRGLNHINQLRLPPTSAPK